MDIDPIQQVEVLVREVHETVHKQAERAHKRYPLTFLFLTTFSVAAVFHGLNQILDTIPAAAGHPETLLAAGLVGLFITGSLYNRLEKVVHE